MQEIPPLQAIPNQRFSVAIAGVNWQLTLKVANQTMFCDIEREGAKYLLQECAFVKLQYTDNSLSLFKSGINLISF